jgi:hypothetical protein
MAYIEPGVLVYQQLSDAAGTTTSTPNLPACVIGPAYNVITYDSSSATSILTSAATSAVTGVGGMTADSAVLTLNNAVNFEVNDTLYVPGAGTSGATLTGVVTAVSGLNFTLNVSAATTVTNVTITKQDVIVDPAIDNPFYIPGQKPGQIVTASSVQVYLNNAVTETFQSVFTGLGGTTALNLFFPTTVTGTTTVSSTNVTAVAGIAGLSVGDTISIAGAGASGAALVAEIVELEIGEDTLVISTPALTAVTAGAITKQNVSNINSATSSLVVQAGAALTLTYTGTNSVASTFTTTVASVPNLTGNITAINTVDTLPANISVATTVATATAAATTITPAVTTGFFVNQPIILAGAGAGGGALLTTITAINAGVFTIANAIVTSVTNAALTGQALVTVQVFQTMNNQLLPINGANSYVNYDLSNLTLSGEVNIHPYPQTVYGTVYSAQVYIAYSALRTDLSGSMLSIASEPDAEAQLGNLTPANPLGFGVLMALAGAASGTGGVNAMAVATNDLPGYTNALELLENQTVYALAPLTQDVAILDEVQAHVDNMSQAIYAAWRIAFVNTAIPTTVNVGQWSSSLVNSNSGNNAITLVSGDYVLTASNATFVADGVVPGNSVVVTASTGTPSQVGNLTVLEVLSNQQLVVQASGTATAVSYYVTSTLSKAQQAAAVAAQSTTFNDQRIYHVQPDNIMVPVNGVDQEVPGYYAACVLAGMTSAYAVQQGFTNMTVPGIDSLVDSNFYFTRSQLDTMAGAGTLLLVQSTQTSSPYVRHQLSTNLTSLNTKELSLVKNLDYLSYFFVQQLQDFIGKYNITTDSLNTLRTSINAGASFLIGQVAANIGAPLLAATITSLAQSTTNADQVICQVQVTLANPLNNILLYLVV